MVRTLITSFGNTWTIYPNALPLTQICAMSQWRNHDDEAMTHIVQHWTDFKSYIMETSNIEGITPGASLRTCGHGSVPVEFKVKDKIYSMTLQDVKHTPNTPNNIISIGRLTNNGHIAHFMRTGIEFKSKNGTIFGTGRKNRQMYQM